MSQAEAKTSLHLKGKKTFMCYIGYRQNAGKDCQIPVPRPLVLADSMYHKKKKKKKYIFKCISVQQKKKEKAIVMYCANVGEEET